MLNFLVGIPLFLLIISVIVTFHEYGHYSIARLFRTRIERFSLGLGNILLRRKDKHGVEWCISAIPLGGYVKFAGDENIVSMSPSEADLEAARAAITAREGVDAVNDYFHFKPLWQRFLIILAGPVFNFILAVFFFAIISFVFPQSNHPSEVKAVIAGSPASQAGFLPRDRIVKVDGHDVTTFEEVSLLVQSRSDTPVPFVVERAGKRVTLIANVGHRFLVSKDGNQKIKIGLLGIEASDKEIINRPNPLQALASGVTQTWQALDQTLTYVSRIFIGKESGSQIGSVVGMTKVTGDLAVGIAEAKATTKQKVEFVVKMGLTLTAVISVGVGFLNLLPIPILDGGHLLFYIYQAITRRPVPQAVQNVAFRMAVVLILGLMMFALWNDMNNHFGLGRVLDRVFS